MLPVSATTRRRHVDHDDRVTQFDYSTRLRPRPIGDNIEKPSGVGLRRSQGPAKRRSPLTRSQLAANSTQLATFSGAVS